MWRWIEAFAPQKVLGSLPFHEDEAPQVGSEASRSCLQMVVLSATRGQSCLTNLAPATHPLVRPLEEVMPVSNCQGQAVHSQPQELTKHSKLLPGSMLHRW